MPVVRTPLLIKLEAGWAPEPVWTSGEKEIIYPSGNRAPDYSAHILVTVTPQNNWTFASNAARTSESHTKLNLLISNIGTIILTMENVK
jgi:hypothetical protein